MATLQRDRRIPDDALQHRPVRIWFRSASYRGGSACRSKTCVSRWRASFWILLLAGAVVWVGGRVGATTAAAAGAGCRGGAAVLAGDRSTARQRNRNNWSRRWPAPRALLRAMLRLANACWSGCRTTCARRWQRGCASRSSGDDADPLARAGMLDDIGEMDALIGETWHSPAATARQPPSGGMAELARASACSASAARPWRHRWWSWRSLGPASRASAIWCRTHSATAPHRSNCRRARWPIEIEVRDHGRGPEQADVGSARPGIGLSLVRAVAAAHGGQLNNRLEHGFAAVLSADSASDAIW
jgi:hypothetical protein